MGSHRILVLLAVLGAAGGCDINYQRSVLAPPVQPVPGDGRAARSGEVRLSGTLVHAVPSQYEGGYGDGSVWVPSRYYEGELELGLPTAPPMEGQSRHRWSLAFVGGTGSSSGAIPTAVNGAPVDPDATTRTWEAGGILRSDVESHDQRWALGFAGRLEDARVPASVWCMGCIPGADPSVWQLVGKGETDVTLWSVGLTPSALLTDPSSRTRLVLFGGLTVGNAVTNTGFDDQSGIDKNPTVNTTGVAILSGGLELDAAPVLLRATAYTAGGLGHSGADQAGFLVSAGLDLGR